MKTNENITLLNPRVAFEEEGEILTAFGTAKLVQFPTGELELQGGSHADRQSAYEWISLFWHEAVVREVAA